MYLDQGGYLIGRFGIRQVPAMVSHEKNAKRLPPTDRKIMAHLVDR